MRGSRPRLRQDNQGAINQEVRGGADKGVRRGWRRGGKRREGESLEIWGRLNRRVNEEAQMLLCLGCQLAAGSSLSLSLHDAADRCTANHHTGRTYRIGRRKDGRKDGRKTVCAPFKVSLASLLESFSDMEILSLRS